MIGSGMYFSIIFMYDTLFLNQGNIWLPFTQFECASLNQVNVAPSLLHPNNWAFIRAFEVLMEFLVAEPIICVFSYFF